MKAIIIDDESHVREGLRLLADWERFGIEMIIEAIDGYEAMALIQEHQPEIIFTDMNMPRCDGIDLLKWLSELKLNCKTIVVSGYDDYKYTRNAIAYGSFDYLLKPIDPVDLNETLLRAVKEWKAQQTDRLTNVEKDLVMLEHQLSNSLSTSSLPKQVIVQMKEQGIDPTQATFTITLIPLKMLINNRFDGNTEKAFSSVLAVCQRILQTNMGYAFRNVNKEQEIAILMWQTKFDFSNILYKEIKQLLDINCIVAMGFASTEVKEAYATAETNLKNWNLLGNNVLKDRDRQYSIVALFDYVEEMKWAIQSGSIEQITAILERIFAIFQERQFFSLEQVYTWETQFEFLREHWLKEYDISRDAPLYEGNAYWERDGTFSFQRFQQEKTKQFQQIVKLVLEAKCQSETSRIQLIEAYLRANYQKDVKLQEIAERFFLSREYISRKFKKEYKATMTDYVMKIRIEQAKKLLENPYMKIYEVAEAVGYPNDKYFIKLFKKATGVTPAEFRNSHK